MLYPAEECRFVSQNTGHNRKVMYVSGNFFEGKIGAGVIQNSNQAIKINEIVAGIDHANDCDLALMKTIEGSQGKICPP
jgi:hypothetical protein